MEGVEHLWQVMLSINRNLCLKTYVNHNILTVIINLIG